MAGDAATSGLRFFLDRGLGSVVVPKALRAAGWLLETMDERYGADQSQNIQDTRWIEEATLAGDVLLCKDLAIAQNRLEAQVVYMTSARVFGLSNASITGPMMAQWYMDNEARIVNAASGAAGPYVMAVNPVYGLRRAKLAYPPHLSYLLRLGPAGDSNWPPRAPEPPFGAAPRAGIVAADCRPYLGWRRGNKTVCQGAR